MKISFVIPARNEEENIGKAIEAILKLPENHVKEIIVADNGSTDNTPQVASAYPKTKVVFEPTPGTNRARQKGLEAATGDIIGFIDSDNWVVANWSEVAMKYLAKPNVVAVAGMYDFRDQNKFARALMFYGFLLYAYPAYLFVHYILRKGSVVQGGNVAVKKEALDKIGGLDTKFVFFGDDVKLGKDLRKIGKVLFSPKLVTTASSRRYKKHGYFPTIFKYFMNFVWVILFDRPFTKPKK